MEEIKSTNNQRLKNLRELLRSKKRRSAENAFVAEGFRTVKTFLESNSDQYVVTQIWISESQKDNPNLSEIRRDNPSLAIICLPETIFKKSSATKNPPGIMAVIKHQPSELVLNPEAGRYLLLDSISDPGNLGTLIRTAAAAEYEAVLLYGKTVELFNPKVIRASMGMMPLIDCQIVGDEIFSALKGSHYELFSTVVENGENIFQTPFPEKSVLIIGNEADGVSAEVHQRADRNLTIPMAEKCESLNSAIAGAICMFQIRNSRS